MGKGKSSLNRVRTGRVTKNRSPVRQHQVGPCAGRSRSPQATNRSRRGRGAPPYNWTPRRCRRLLRLYTMTPLNPDSIGRVLKRGSFSPKASSVRSQLKKLLGDRYWQFHTSDKRAMYTRLAIVKHGPQKLACYADEHLYSSKPTSRAGELITSSARSPSSGSVRSTYDTPGSSIEWKSNASHQSARPDIRVSNSAAITSTHLSNKNEHNGPTKSSNSVSPPIGPGSRIQKHQNMSSSQVDLTVRSFPTSITPKLSSSCSNIRPTELTAPSKSFPTASQSLMSDPSASCQRSSWVPSLHSLRRRIGSPDRSCSTSSFVSLVGSVLNASRAESMIYQERSLQWEGLSYERPLLDSLYNVTRFVSSFQDPSTLTVAEEGLFNELIDEQLLDNEEETQFSVESTFVAPWRHCCHSEALMAGAERYCKTCGLSRHHYAASTGHVGFIDDEFPMMQPPDFFGNTCYHFLASSGAPVSLLRKYFLDIKFQKSAFKTNAVGYTALHVLNPQVFGYGLQELVGFLEDLAKFGCNFRQMGCDGRNFLHNLLWHPKINHVSPFDIQKILETTRISIGSEDSTGRRISSKLKEWYGAQHFSMVWNEKARWPPWLSSESIDINRGFVSPRLCFRDILSYPNLYEFIPEDYLFKNPNFMDDFGETILHAMIAHRSMRERGSTEPILRMLRSGVDVNVCSRNGTIPLVLAMSTGQYDLIEDILEIADDDRIIRLQIYTYAKLLIELLRILRKKNDAYADALKSMALIIQSLEKHHQPLPERFEKFVDLLHIDSE